MGSVSVNINFHLEDSKVIEINNISFGNEDGNENLADEIKTEVANLLNVRPDDFYLTQNGMLLSNCSNQTIVKHSEIPIKMVPRLLGGKGGFGSMLRAIGAQIEKTTNREACRDLSGRRLRDINEEQRLKRWFAKQKQREEEKEELKRKKLEKLRNFCEGAPLPLIQDPEYNRQRAEMADSVFEAVDKGFEASISETSTSQTVEVIETVTASTSAAEGEVSSSTSSSSSEEAVSSTSGEKNSNQPKKEVVKPGTIKRTFFDEDLDSDVSDSDSEEDVPAKKAKLC